MAWEDRAMGRLERGTEPNGIHMGYNSVFGSTAWGVPMICKPLWGDNMMNGRMVKGCWSGSGGRDRYEDWEGEGIGVGVEEEMSFVPLANASFGLLMKVKVEQEIDDKASVISPANIDNEASVTFLPTYLSEVSMPSWKLTGAASSKNSLARFVFQDI
ncbi:hypothetical protein NL676_035775 [Syzygium grande]|nr:hypothetical protein NL676_035775 [Syzygium grande]